MLETIFGLIMVYVLIGFFFSDIYLIQWSIKKFIIKKQNYCKIK